MKRTLTIAIVVLCLIGTFVYLLKTNESVGVLLLGESTAYSPSFQDSVFRSLDIGISGDEASRRLGEPLRCVTNGHPPGFSWVYSESDPNGKAHNFRIRVLHFDAQGHLIRKETGLYVD